MIKASVIIPNWDGKELLKDCLQSLFRQTVKDFEIILVDNGSEDNSVEYTKRFFPKVRIIRLSKNYGFAKAVNEGVKASGAKYVVFLNNDTAVDRNWLKNLIDSADTHPEAISINPKIVNYFDRKRIDGVGIEINEVGQAQSVGWNEIDTGQYEKEQYIFGATGGASLFRRKEFVRVGRFDESFFMYFEEVDFAFRAQFLGYKSIYCPTALVYHKHKATAKKLPQHIEYWQFKNMKQTIIKNFPAGILFKKWRWLKIILVHLNTLFYQFRNGFFWPPLVVQSWLIFNIPSLLTKRAKVQKTRKVSDQYIESFLKPKKITFWGILR